MDNRMTLSSSEKQVVIANTKLCKENTLSKWYKYRNAVVVKAANESESTVPLLKQILIVLVKIYWEMKKPNANK